MVREFFRSNAVVRVGGIMVSLDPPILSVTENERGGQAFPEILGWSGPAVKRQPLWSMKVHNSQPGTISH
jgi:hypothetical protein